MMPSLPKPVFGQPCNGCGLCCIAEQCPLSLEIFGPEEVCPALLVDASRYSCGLISQPERFFAANASEHAANAMDALSGGKPSNCDAIYTLQDHLAAARMSARGELEDPSEERCVLVYERIVAMAMDAK